MSSSPILPLLKRVPPGAWVAAAWCAGMALTFLMRVRLPGELAPTVRPGVLFLRWDGLLTHLLATVLLLTGCTRLTRRPLVAVAVLLAASVVATLPLSVAEIPLAQFLSVYAALYFVAATRPLRTGVLALVMSIAVPIAYVSYRALAGWPAGTSAELVVALTAVVAWLVGRSVYESRRHDADLTARATDRALVAERLRIAREMHDVVAHSVGIIALQAGAAARVVHTQPDAAREAMSAVEAAGRETLSGLRRMLGALRESAPGEEEAPRGPAEGLADVGRLAEATTAAGVRVEVEWRGERRALPPELELSAFRVIQESVTNVVRHAGTDACRVCVRYGVEELSVEVTDRGRGAGQGAGRDAAPGFGLVGMRERVALLHGEFAAGPVPGGGFRVTARFPVPPPGTLSEPLPAVGTVAT
ncbi:sensor histidine kinase [Streptomyces sp. NBC_00525]|uniref:sensor histidine kinase n=1 Tax=Streptomyces sp. NBC_00525 TaxID=2903660 RepID=UPI002E8055E9|nr:sensor histidine kinase [Streptomyces sp. NBC_00525]WUC95803.1 sensor histidine kinase [Streptomyces sp. NBC_00525]